MSTRKYTTRLCPCRIRLRQTMPSLWDLPPPLSLCTNSQLSNIWVLIRKHALQRGMSNAKWLFSNPTHCRYWAGYKNYWPTSWVAFASPPVVGLIAAGLRGFFMASCVGWFSLFISPRVMSFTWKKNKSNDFATQRIRVQFLWLQKY